MTSDIEHLFTCSLAICESSVKCQIMASVHFLVELFHFFMVEFGSSFYALDINSLSYMSFANIFSQSVPCLFVFLTGSFANKFLDFWGGSVYQFSLWWIVLLVSSLIIFCLAPNPEGFFSYFFLKWPWSILSSFLDMVCHLSQEFLFVCLVWFGFCLWMSNCFSTICWKGCPSSIELLLHLCEKSCGHTFATTWMNLEGIMLSEMSGRERPILYDTTYTWNLKNKAN